MSQQAIGQGVIEIIAEASGLTASIAEAVAAATRGGQAIGQAVSEGAAKAGDGIELLDGKVQRYINTVSREIASTELSRAAYRAWEAQAKGISENVYGPLVARLAEAQQKREAEAEAAKESARVSAAAARAQAEEAAALARANQQRESFVAGLRDQIAVLGRSAEETLRYRAAQAGAAGEASHLITQLTSMRAAHDAAAQAAKENAEAQRRATQVQNENNAFVTSLEKQAQAIGKSRADLLEMEAAQRGVTAAAAPHIAALRAQEQALRSQAAATNVAGMSQKQYNAALRGVPTQITDIVVSLQGGQAPLTVLLQQGGQLKDMFNGVVPAVRALGGELLKLAANPFVLTAAAVAALAYAFYSGSKEQDAYVKALATTGNRAGVTAGQLQSAARAMGDVASTQGAAAEALSALVSEGGVRGLTDLTRYAETARDAQKYLGVEVKETAKAFADLAKDPLKASERLTEQMGYLTHAQYLQIKALEDVGDRTGAAAVAQRAYDDAVRTSTAQVQANLGIIERAWGGITSAIKESIDWAKRVGRPDSGEDRMATMQRTLELARNQERVTGDPSQRLKIEAAMRSEGLRQLREVDNAMARQEEQRTNEEKIAAQKRYDATVKATRDRATIRKEELEEFRRDAATLKLTQQQIADGEKAINEKYKDRAQRKPREYSEDAALRSLTSLKEAEAALRAQLTTQDKLTEAQRAYAKFEAEIAEIKTKSVLTADQKALLAAEDKLRAQHQVNVGVAEEVRLKLEGEKADKARQQAIDQYVQSIERLKVTMDSAQASQDDALARLTNTAGRGSLAARRSEEERQLQQQYERFRTQANRAAVGKGQAGADPADLAAIQSRQDAALASLRNYYATEDKLRSDWRTGFTRTFEDYYDSAQNVADRVSDALTRGLTSVEDAFVSLATTGKASFSGLANSIIADVVRISVRMAMANAIGGGGGGGWLGSLFGAALSYFGGGAGGGTAVNGSALNTTGGGAIFASEGGYTGRGGKYDFAGYVHKGEIVWSQEDIQEAGGVGVVERMRKRGYANGGVVGGSAGGGMGGMFNVYIQNNGTETDVKQQRNSNGGIDLLVIAKQLEQQIGGNVAAGVGPVARGMEGRYGLRPSQGR